MAAKRVDVFPALVRVAEPGSLDDFCLLNPTGDAPNGTRKVDRCRLVVIYNKLVIAVDSPSGFDLIFREELTDYASEGKVHHFLTASGKILAAQKDANCGCGSRLRTWNPFGSDLFSDRDPEDA
jgi:hypothetical protein